MFRTSDLLKNTRLEKDLSIEEISKKLKIPAKYLVAIEAEDTACFPQQPYCSLIIKDYADFLGLDGLDILKLFHRDFFIKKKPKLRKQKSFSFTPQFTFTLLTVIAFIGFSLYLGSEYIKFNRPPPLKVNWPAQQILNSSTLDLTGATDPESTVRINQDLVIVDTNGNFYKKLTLSSGENKILVESKSPAGITTSQEKTLQFNQ